MCSSVCGAGESVHATGVWFDTRTVGDTPPVIAAAHVRRSAQNGSLHDQRVACLPGPLRPEQRILARQISRE